MTVEQVCQALNQQCAAWLEALRGTSRLEYTSAVIRYHQRRNRAAKRSRQRQAATTHRRATAGPGKRHRPQRQHPRGLARPP